MLGFACFAASHTDTNEERGGAVRSFALVLLALASTDALAQGCALTSGAPAIFRRCRTRPASSRAMTLAQRDHFLVTEVFETLRR